MIRAAGGIAASRRRRIGLAISPRPTTFGPVLFAGRMDEGIATARRLGFGLIELSLRSAADVNRKSLRSKLRAAGIAVSAIATGQACLFDGLCLSSTSESVRRNTIEHLRQEMELAAQLEASIILGGIRGRLDSEGGAQERARAAAVEAIEACVSAADRLGVQVLIEPINRYETNYLNTIDEVLDLIQQLRVGQVKVLLDTFHMNIEESRFEAAIRRAGPRLGYVHIVDSNRRAPGQGHVPFDAVMETLDAVGFDGPLVAEILPIPDDATAAQLTARFWATTDAATL
jgi:sugar phosphate isomerase/epimerase